MNKFMDKIPKENVSKIYCEKCNSIFSSREKYDAHYSKHSSGVSCDSCPIDMAIEKIMKLFQRKK